MLDVIYRFRSTDALLGKRKELERHEIFLASWDKLNDPMEGYKNAFWKGDPVLWENLLRHYVLALLWEMMQCVLLPNDGTFDPPAVPFALTQDDLYTDALRQLYADICDEFFKRTGPALVLRHLTSLTHSLHYEGMRLVLSLVHGDAFDVAFTNLVSAGLLQKGDASNYVAPPAGTLEKMLTPFTDSKNPPEVDFEDIAFASNRTHDSVALTMLYQIEAEGKGVPGYKTRHLLLLFPDHYLRSIVDGLVHFSWRTACFSRTCTNASVWATYGDNHKGVALIFRPQVEDGAPCIPLKGIVGHSYVLGQPTQPTRGDIRGELRPVTYTSRAPEIDFFQSLGTLPRVKVEGMWHRGGTGEYSPLIQEGRKDEARWREAYWASYRQVMTTKLEDWKHEEEYRVVLPEILGPRTDDESLVTYDFASLVGVVFGLRTTDRDKAQIMTIVANECKRLGRTDFEFKQIVYEQNRGALIAV
jgi:hypothetical protein